MLLDNELFYECILELCRVAGITTASFPLTYNQSPKQVVYIESETDLLLTTYQRRQLDSIECVSHLFDIPADAFDDTTEKNKISFYSVVLSTTHSDRSQLAADTHAFLHTSFGSEVSIIFYKYNEYTMLSMSGFGHQSILSDWFSLYDEYDVLLDKLDIANFSIKSSKAFFIDFVFNCARWYYTHPFSYDYAALELFPVDYFKENDIHDVEQEELELLVRKLKNKAIIEYGDDYVDQDDITVTVTSDYNLDLELLLLDIDDEEQDQNPFGEDPYEDDYPDDDLDEYEYEDLDSELLENPILLMKWLEKQDK